MAATSGCGPGEAESTVAESLPTGASPRFQNVRDKGEVVCGEVNPRSGAGGYRRFVYLESARTASIERLEAAPAAEPDRAACGKREAYQTVDERLACASAPAAQAEASERQQFERLWQANCR